MKNNWWKITCVIALLYTAVAGFLMPVPALEILNETIRNLFFHVPMWFGQIVVFTISVVYALKYLLAFDKNKTNKTALLFAYDNAAFSAIKVGMVYGILGLLTGMMWGNYTWGSPWVNDPKLTCVAIGMLLYLAYFVLRSSFVDSDKRARFSAIYSVFSYVMFIVLIFIIPRMKEFSIHPGNGGNPGFASYDLDNRMRLVFYPAVMGWSLLAVWIWTLVKKVGAIKQQMGF
jgi:heme exporter protein C